ncbi:DUF1236 domain-containing protein [Paracoccaceae bacterium Fryx2]|nr:DUF1236 domain-containing protein [Paracoccaceae bacterium Fryx2]
MFTKSALTAVIASFVFVTAAQAEVQAMAGTDLNLRAGPGPMYEILGVIPSAAPVAVLGCLEAASWCQVSYDGKQGWASGDYLTAMVENVPAPIYVNREKVAVGTVTYEDTTAASTVGGGTMGAVAGALIAGPIGAAVGAVIGGGMGAAADPGPTVTSYVVANPVEPIYLDGEVVLGSGIPEGVTLAEVPDSEFSYAYVNGLPVIVERKQRQVVYIVR